LSFPQDRSFVTRFERPKTPVDLAALLNEHSAKHLHVSSFLAALENPDAARIAHDAGLTVSMDPGWDEEALCDPRLRTMIDDLDVFLPSESELCHVAGTDDVEAALAQVAATMKRGQIVLKQGARGATAYSRDHRESVPALPVTPVDTTGAGDSFDAGFLFRYAGGAPLTECLQYGAVCGALSTTRVGGATAAPTNQEVQQWLSKLQS
jgi:sugar/nucleoside kinase (ribokinase family)